MPPEDKNSRPLRIASEIRRELPDIIRRHIIIPAGLLVSVTQVEVSSDLGMAKVYFSVLGGHERQAAMKMQQQLNAKRGIVRTEIARRLVMRQHPEFKFIYDDTPARAARIESLLNQIRNDTAPGSGAGE